MESPAIKYFKHWRFSIFVLKNSYSFCCCFISTNSIKNSKSSENYDFGQIFLWNWLLARERYKKFIIILSRIPVRCKLLNYLQGSYSETISSNSIMWKSQDDFVYKDAANFLKVKLLKHKFCNNMTIAEIVFGAIKKVLIQTAAM